MKRLGIHVELCVDASRSPADTRQRTTELASGRHSVWRTSYLDAIGIMRCAHRRSTQRQPTRRQLRHAVNILARRPATRRAFCAAGMREFVLGSRRNDGAPNKRPKGCAERQRGGCPPVAASATASPPSTRMCAPSAAPAIVPLSIDGTRSSGTKQAAASGSVHEICCVASLGQRIGTRRPASLQGGWWWRICRQSG